MFILFVASFTVGKDRKERCSIMARKRWDELDLMDNELMNIVASDPNVGVPFCKRVLSVLLEKEIENIRVNVQRYIPGVDSGRRGVCLDVEVEEEQILDGTQMVTEVFDLEPHHADKTDDYPRMMRYRQAKIDSGRMKKGDNKYSHLPNLYVILITDFDLFGDGQRLYTFQHRCLESPEVTYEDGLRILYFNTKGTKGGSQSVQNMLNYLQESKATSVVDEATREIDGYVRGVKENPKAEEAYMTIGDIIDREVEEAVGKAVEKAVEEAVENNTKQVTWSTKVNDILELLEDADGDISEALKEALSEVADPEQLKILLKYAAKADSVAEFEQKMKDIQ